jgi:hypothetical protein
LAEPIHRLVRTIGLPLIVISLVCLSAAAQEGPQFDLQTSARRSERYPIEYKPITSQQRLEWFARSTVGGTSLLAGLFSSGLGTAIDTPSEYGPHWDGFAKRYGMRLTGLSTGNAIEASLGAAWGEDPRYFSVNRSPFGSRVRNIVDLTFRAYGPDGQRHLAYARYGATFGNNVISNTWREQSEADLSHALVRTAEGFGVRALSNTFREFLPQGIRKLRHKLGPGT